MSTSAQRRKWILVGSLVAVVGIVTTAVMWFLASSRQDDAIENLARAPVNCDSVVDFAETGVYLVFVETTGEFEAVSGDCPASGSYALATSAPAVDVSVVDPDGDDVRLINRRGDVDYDGAGFAGASRFAIDVRTPGDHVVRVESTAEEAFAIAIGRDPADGVGALRTIGVILGLLGLLGGALIATLGGRSSSGDGAPTPAAPSGWGVPPAPGSAPGPWNAPPPTGPPSAMPPIGPPAAPGAPPPQSPSSPNAHPGAPGQPVYGGSAPPTVPTVPGPPGASAPPVPGIPGQPVPPPVGPPSGSPAPAVPGVGDGEHSPWSRPDDSAGSSGVPRDETRQDGAAPGDGPSWSPPA